MSENDSGILKQLLLMPRATRAREQGIQASFEINGVHVKRHSRQYWVCGKSYLKLKDATELLEKEGSKQ